MRTLQPALGRSTAIARRAAAALLLALHWGAGGSPMRSRGAPDGLGLSPWRHDARRVCRGGHGKGRQGQYNISVPAVAEHLLPLHPANSFVTATAVINTHLLLHRYEVVPF